MKKIRITFFFALFFTVNGVWAQEITVSGTVTDHKDKLPLPGVSVLIRGTTIGTQTDANGHYQIKAPYENAELEFRFLGYAPQLLRVDGRTAINVSMVMEAQTLGPVVVTALGQARKRNELPFAAQNITGEEVNRTRDPNFIGSLHGKVAGLDISQNNNMGGSTRMIIRGPKSFFGNNQALVVIDGVPFNNSSSNTANQSEGGGGYDYGNPAADLNPDDIESINVLKGAAASALYGSRASNGVIIITTKKRKSKDPGFSIALNSSVQTGTMDKSTFTHFQQEYGAGYGPNYESPDGYFWYRDLDGDGEMDLIVPMGFDASYGARFDPNLMVYDWTSFDPTSPNYKQKRPWLPAKNGPESFFTNPLTLNNSINISAGGEQGYFKLGFSRSDEKGILPNSKLGKNTLSFSASHQLVKKLNIEINSNFSKTTGLGRYGTGYDGDNGLNLATNLREWWQTNVDIKELKDAYFRTRKNMTWNWSDPTDLTPIYWDNPYWTRYENYENDNRNRFWGNVSLSWEINSWLSATGRISLDGYDEVQEQRMAVGSKGVSQYMRYNRTYAEYNYDLLLNFKRKLNANLSMNGLIGTNFRRTQSATIRARSNGGLLVPHLYALSNSINPINAPIEYFGRIGVDGVFASATLGYKELAFLDLTARRDESTTLPEKNRAYYYPSAAASLIFSKLIKNQDWLSYGKFRINYAEVGNSAPAQSLLDVYDQLDPFGKVSRFSVSETKNNAELKPERTKSIEGGLELGFWNGRLGFDITFYRQNSVDQIIPIPVSTATGYDYKYINSGTIRNQGIELSLNGSPVAEQNFSWNIMTNFASNRNMVTVLPSGRIELANFQGGVSSNADEGQPYGVLNGTDFVFHENGQPMVDDTGHYLITPTSDKPIGDVNPKWNAGITNSFTCGNASLSFLVDMSYGGKVFSLDQSYGLSSGLPQETAGLNDLGNPSRLPLDQGGGIILPGVKEDGTPNDIRIANINGTYGYDTQPNAAFVYDATYVKLREVSLGYKLPSRLISKLPGVKGVHFSLVGRNLWIIHKNLPYADPEDGLSDPNLKGFQVGSYPTYRTYGFNVRVNF
ncbi:MAG: SusC/RagA family TonB-linked outer membrane protein [Sphingobacteriaceae bacterium]